MGSFFLTGHIWHIGGEGRGAAGRSPRAVGWYCCSLIRPPHYIPPVTCVAVGREREEWKDANQMLRSQVR